MLNPNLGLKDQIHHSIQFTKGGKKYVQIVLESMCTIMLKSSFNE